jgi:hypothetical protein
MRLLKQALAILGSVVVVAMVVALSAPKAVHAVVAAAVNVMNTSANPVPTYDAGVRFQADVCEASGAISSAASFCGTNTLATFTVPTTTASGATVKHLIVDDVSGTCSSYNNPTLFIKSVRLTGQFVADSVPNGESAAVHYVPIIGAPYSYVNGPQFGASFNNVPETDYTYGQTTHFSFNPGDTVTLNFIYYWPGSGGFDGGCYGRIEGTLATQ